MGDGNGWIRRTTRAGRLLITSRNRSHEAWGPWVSLWPLGVLPSQAATELLLDRVPGVGTEVQAATLAERLGQLPLLLHQAGLYLFRADRNPPWPDQPRCFISPTTVGVAYVENSTPSSGSKRSTDLISRVGTDIPLHQA